MDNMDNFEDKLNKILSSLSSPEEMGKIMGLARSFSGSSQDGEHTPQPTGGQEPGGLTSMLGNIDPKVLSLLSRVLGEYSSKDNDKTALISALKPYLKEDRCEKIDRAAQVAKLARLAKSAFSEFSGGGGDV